MNAGTTQSLYADPWWLERPYQENAAAHGDARSALERDRDRIVHSRALRRLGGKTQVIGSPWAYDFRNRLTHTVEVSQVGRALARRHGIEEALVEASCLAHDIGHPPFGHAGERALNRRMEPWGGFDANAQTLRAVQQLEIKGQGTPGLNLTRATLWSILKYPYRRVGGTATAGGDELAASNLRIDANGKAVADRQFLYDEDLAAAVHDGRSFAEWLGDGRMDAALLPESRLNASPPQILACRLMDWSDDLAYAIHDFEDAVFAGFITQGAIERVYTPLLAAVQADVGRYYTGCLNLLSEGFDGWQRPIDGLLRDVQRADNPESVLRPQTRDWFGTLVDAAKIVPPSNADLTTQAYQVDVPRKSRTLVSVLSNLGFELLIRDERIVRYLRKGTMMLERSFDELMGDPKVVDDRVGQLMPRHLAHKMAGMAEQERARHICDYLSSMSEPALTHFYRTLFEADAGSPFF